MQNDKIAVVGMAGRFPGAADTEKLWELLEAGLDIHHEVPAERFDVSAYFDKNQHNSRTPYGSFIDGLGFFDPQFFGMPPLEAAQMDPMSRLTLTTAYEALEMSGYTANAAEDAGAPFRTRRVRRSASSRINYHCKLCGPSYSVDTACSSSLVAMGLACTSLWAGDCDTACAGGLSLLIYPGNFSCHGRGKLLWNFNDIELHASRLVQTFITKGEDL
ncbi:hypothetical protein SNOG_11981 [Neofusicoccum parvum]|nr:hypothetical protein SNOG_11981 [Neofusicoccum parvum]